MSLLATFSRRQQLDRACVTVDRLRVSLGLGNTRPVGMGQSVFVEYLVDCADIVAPVKVDRGIGELDHRFGCEAMCVGYQRLGV